MLDLEGRFETAVEGRCSTFESLGALSMKGLVYQARAPICRELEGAVREETE